MARAKRSQTLTKAEHYANLKWLKDKGFYLDVRQFAKLQEYQADPELNPEPPKAWYHD